VQTRLHSNPVEFDGIKGWIVESLPSPEKIPSEFFKGGFVVE